MSIVKEFKDFISRGNVIDLAVGVIVGGAFGKIVTSLVDQVIMPPIGLITGGIDFSDLKIVLKAAGTDVKLHPEVAIQYGAFINVLIQFTIVAFVIFLVVKGINSLRRQEAEAPVTPAAPTTSEALLAEIRDALVVKKAPAVAAPVAKAAVAKAPVAKAPASKAAAKTPAAKALAKKPAAKK
jgi:large conductance mechanosensitive channel